MNDGSEPALYFGHVMHTRLRPFRHRFVYRVFSMFVDVDGLGAQAAGMRLFSHNRFNLFSLMDRDHGAADGTPIRPWVEAQLSEAGITAVPRRIAMLCFPRLLGFVFNPLTVFFCFDDRGKPLALIYEVRNRVGGKHPYVIRINADNRPGALLTHQHRKDFYVSPFLEMDMTYRFRISEPGEKLAVMIRETAPEGEMLIATLTGARRPFTDRSLIRAFCAYPMMTLKVVAAIHFEALRLWRKGARLVPRDGTATN